MYGRNAVNEPVAHTIMFYVFMQAINAFMQAVNAIKRLPVLSNLLVWSETFSTHCTAANRRDTVPIHYISLLVLSQHHLLRID